MSLRENPAGQCYAAQLGTMAKNAAAWRLANPDKLVTVQFNFPKHVALIAPISRAICEHFVSANEAGLELIKAMGRWGESDEPTVLMVRVVLEHDPGAIEQERTDSKGKPLPEAKCPTCNQALTHASGAGHKKRPSRGDLTVCIYCGQVLEFGPDMVLQIAPEAVLSSMDDETRQILKAAQKAVRSNNE